MQNREKKIAAISAGIAYYLQEEQEAAQMMQQDQTQAQAQAQAQQRPAFPVNSPWAMAGRQAIMERRYQWQFRLTR
ncbi:MAG: hypothetical protein K9J48_01850 [Desulfohalobiaceae bacterium]|nr:hypothetical protein [Desulfohalobiaceae bacterium]